MNRKKRLQKKQFFYISNIYHIQFQIIFNKSSSQMSSSFVKMHGAGNDFLVVEPSFFGFNNKRKQEDTFSQEESQKITTAAIKLCRKNFGVGADGILIISQISEELYKMTIFSSDGALGNMCGNGLRCVAAYLSQIKKLGKKFMIATDDGIKQAIVQNNSNHLFSVEISLGIPENFSILVEKFSFDKKQLISGITDVSAYICTVGVHHIVMFFTDSQWKAIEQANAYNQIFIELNKIRNANVNFCLIESKESFKIVTREQGAGLTLACGTGSSSSAYIGFILGLLSSQSVAHTRGGDIKLTILEKEGKHEVFMQGPAEFVFTGSINSQFN